jgi:hypothetical protein
MKNIHQHPDFRSCYLFILLITISCVWLSSCSELPSKSEGPDNLFDPKNPNNLIEGPALILSPVKININNGDNFQTELWIVEANTPISGVTTRIEFDPDVFSVEGVNEIGQSFVIHSDTSSVDSSGTGSESFLLQNGGQLIFIYDIDAENGYLDIDCAVVEGNPRDVTGSGTLAKITFKHLTVSTDSESQLEISQNSLFSDSNSNPVAVNHRLGSQVTIK